MKSTQIDKEFYIPSYVGKGSKSTYYRFRTLFQYLALLGLAVTGWNKLTEYPEARVALLGFVFPGGSYLANPSPLNIGLFVLTVVFLPITFFIWFASGALLAPLLNYLAPIAIGTYLNRNADIWEDAIYCNIGIASVFISFFVILSYRLAAANTRLRHQRNKYVPRLAAEIAEHKRLDESDREIDLQTLRFVQYFIELGLQDFDDWTGFNIIDQFQTSSLRYQLYEIVYSLGTYQAIYAPSLRGAVVDAQVNAINKSVTKRVMGYWKWESLFGHFSWKYDPIEWDNIMVSGYLLKALGIFTSNNHDMRFAEPDSLTFEITNSAKFKHDIHSINKYVLRNWEAHPYTVFPCEPNWVYTPCNLYGCAGSISYDTAFNQKNFEKKRASILKLIHEELSDELGTLIPIKSSFTGMTIPGIAGPCFEAFSAMDLTLLDEASGIRAWVILREEYLQYESETAKYKFKGLTGSDMMDMGNYKISEAAPAASFAMNAAEHGDYQIAKQLIKQIDEEYCPVVETPTGSCYNDGLSNWLKSFVLRARLCRFRDWTYTVTVGAPKQCKVGPLLSGYDFQNVLVAKAYSHDGTDLDLVLYNGRNPGTFSLKVTQLVAGASYTSEAGDLEADATGTAIFPVHLDGRTAVHIKLA